MLELADHHCLFCFVAHSVLFSGFTMHSGTSGLTPV